MAPLAENQTERRRSVAKTQRIVYNWYETHHSDEEIIDIYSPEWAKRIAEWQEWLFQTHHTINVDPNTIRLHLRTPNQIDLPLFFSAYPIAAFSLRQTLQACYDLDRAVCLNSRQKTEEWQSMRPFEYMESEEVRQTWGDELKRFKKEIRMQILETGEIKLRVFALFSSLERLETAVRLAKENFVDLDVEIRELMLGRIQDMLNQRCDMIAKILKVEGQGKTKEDTDDNYETLSDSIHNSNHSTQIEAKTEYTPKLQEKPLSTPTGRWAGLRHKRSHTKDREEIKKRRH